MTRDDMIRLAHEAGWKYADGDDGYAPLWEFGELVAASEREACAKVCDKEINPNADKYEPVSQYQSGCYITAEFLAATIRARGQG